MIIVAGVVFWGAMACAMRALGWPRHFAVVTAVMAVFVAALFPDIDPMSQSVAMAFGGAVGLVASVLLRGISCFFHHFSK
ncbi:MAG: hypothetical protein AAF968_03440 [Pseudomonadota bacterium]